MLIDPDKLQRWMNHFYGYGSWDARIWFVSHEDGGGDLPEDVAEKLNYFHDSHPGVSQPTLCDIRELYKHAALRISGPKATTYKNLFDYRFGDQGLLNGVWKNLIAFSHAYRGESQPDMLSYQKYTFASKSEALIKLYPLPAPHNHAWYYSWLDMPSAQHLKSREQYEDHLFLPRIHSILTKIASHRPDIVLMYGMNNINRLKETVLTVNPQAKFRMVKAEKLKIPQHHRAEIGETTLIITTQIPALRHNRAETGFDWEAFGGQAK